MRTHLLLATLFAFPLAAHADAIDDFTLTGGGHTITFSEPASTIIMDHPHIVYLTENASSTIDGVAGYTDLAAFFLPFPNTPEMTLTVPTFIDASGELTFYNSATMLSYVVLPVPFPTFAYPDNLALTFIPGPYALNADSLNAPPVPYTLTITPEAATPATPTPEPTSITLLATGTLGLLGLAGRHRH